MAVVNFTNKTINYFANKILNMAAIKNIIFDLGGVLINIDYNKTAAAFKKLGAENFDSLYSQTNADRLFEDLETGLISEQSFYEKIKIYCYPSTTYQQVRQAWNEILLDFRKTSLDFLGLIKNKYQLYLLSNTNSIHQAEFEKILIEETGRPPLGNYFIKIYYSHIIHQRKPYPSTYDFVLRDANINAAETLFIDDSVVNIEGAKVVGIQTHLLQPNEKIELLGL